MRKMSIMLLLFLIAIAPAVMAVGEYADQAVESSDIQVLPINIIEYITSSSSSSTQTFSLATMNIQGQYVGSFKAGETLKFVADMTTFNVACKPHVDLKLGFIPANPSIIVEVYDASGKFRSALKYSSFSSAEKDALNKGGNNYFAVQIPYTISSSESSLGNWQASTYFFCSDKTLTDIDGNGKVGQGERISKFYDKGFSVISAAANTCTPGNIGGLICLSSLPSKSASGEDVYQVYQNADCSSTDKRVTECTSTQVCQAGKCVGADVCGDNVCSGDEKSETCLKDCPKVEITTQTAGGGVTTTEVSTNAENIEQLQAEAAASTPGSGSGSLADKCVLQENTELNALIDITLRDDSSQSTCKEELFCIDTFGAGGNCIDKRKSLLKEEIKSSTSTQLAQSACNSDVYCAPKADYVVGCRSIDYLKDRQVEVPSSFKLSEVDLGDIVKGSFKFVATGVIDIKDEARHPIGLCFAEKKLGGTFSDKISEFFSGLTSGSSIFIIVIIIIALIALRIIFK